MLLRDKEGVKIPEAGLDISGEALARTRTGTVATLPVGRHFLKAHLEEYLTELMPNFVQGM